ncbi:hypothetical protein [Clostridium vincentii]|uniref:Uncharacterized protein n=1 Tax=Clostridium vincentii TaxID=52704 RepID=A0A2T0BFC9_9CLOT|nr:hypothetical protein [Clostridium vincentii]PRR82616.1 hypothetical protein CLVI_15830 [Clostridium vincentii]
MYERIRFSVARELEIERRKISKTNKISFIKTDLKKHDDGSSFKEKYEEAKREINLEDKEGVIVSSSLSKKIEENKELERLVEEKLVQNPLLKEILAHDDSETPKDE